MATIVELFRNETEFQRFTRGQRIFAEGDPGDMMYVVFEGEVELSVKGRSASCDARSWRRARRDGAD